MSRTISGTYASGITLTSTANNPVTVTASGRITRASGVLGALYGKGGTGTSWTIDNAGLISGGTNTGGVYLGGFASTVSSGVVINETGGSIAGNLYAIFVNGAASVTNQSGATISASGNSALYLRGAGSTVVNYGVITDSGNTAVELTNGGSILNGAGGTISSANIGIRLDTPGTVTNAGLIAGPGIEAVLFASPNTSNRLIVAPGGAFTGKVAGGTGVLELANGGAAVLGTAFGTSGITNFSTLQFDPGAQWTVQGDASAPGLGTIAINGFTAGDTIDLTGFVAASETFANNALVLTNAINAHATLNVRGSFTTADFRLASDGAGGTLIVTCFAAGTRIDTPEGPVSVERLTAGDRVKAHFAGTAPIRWVGRRHVDCVRHPEPAQVWPVRVMAHAFGHNRPRRDLYLSPNHAIFADGLLLPVRTLINGATVTQIPTDRVTYYHIELPAHDVVWAEGVMAESYLDAGDRENFENGGGVTRLFPDFAGPSVDVAGLWEMKACAPLVLTGPRLERARRLLLGDMADGSARTSLPMAG